jgi:hypothetical protein
MVLRITDKEYDGLDFDLDAAISRYIAEREAHKTTVGVPAPSAHPLVEAIVRRHNGEYEIAKTKTYIRVVDGMIMDKKDMAVPPLGPEWVEATRPDQLMNHYWDEESQAWIKIGSKAAKIEQLERVNKALELELADVKAKLGKFSDLNARLAALENKPT